MLEILDLKVKLEESKYRELKPRLRAELRDLQQRVFKAGIPVVVLFEGWDAAGKGDSIGNLVYALDPRGFKVHTTSILNEEEQLHPFLWRFWTRLPPRGSFVFLDRGWYHRMLLTQVENEIDGPGMLVEVGQIREFERHLTDAGHVLIKFWLQVSKKEQKRRLKDIEADRYERWRATESGAKKRGRYKQCVRAAEQMLALTSTANAPWMLVEADDKLHRRVKAFEGVIASLKAALSARGLASASSGEPDPPPEPAATVESVSREGLILGTEKTAPTVLDRIDLSLKLDREDYKAKLKQLQRRLRELQLKCHRQQVGVVVVYQGWDAAGKGGNIKRLTRKLDPRGYEVIPISSPDATEEAHHYMWRFWRQLPRAGQLAIFDRSWYGRVLVERVEGFAGPSEWGRAFQEINEFERHLTGAGTVLVKFWLHLSPEEQLRRFEARERTAHKRHKITPEDWRNRAKWNEYRQAVVEMIERTSTPYGPWTIVEAEDKLWARIKTLSTLIARLEQRLA